MTLCTIFGHKFNKWKNKETRKPHPNAVCVRKGCEAKP